VAKKIRIEWEGSYSLEDIGYNKNEDSYSITKNTFLNDGNIDYGIYQVYGSHPVYGTDVLLYIGKAQKQTFAKRLSQEAWEYNEDFQNIKFYIGRLFDEKQVSNEEWDEMIDKAEQMLIYAHSPAKNSSNILNISRNDERLKELENIRVLNYDSYRSLMPEVSGEIFIKEFKKYNGVFGSKELKNG